MTLEEIKEMNRDEVLFRLSDIEAKKHALNIEAQSDVNQFGKLQFDLSSAQSELTVLGNCLIERMKELENSINEIVTFYYKQVPLFEKRMNSSQLNKITLNDFICYKNEKYVVYSKFWNIDDDLMYIMLYKDGEY